MSEETTKNFGGEESFEARMLAELAALRQEIENRFAALKGHVTAEFRTVDARLASIEGRAASVELKVDAPDAKVDARLRATRPIRESVLQQLKMIDTKFDVHAHDMLELRAKMRDLEQRVPPAA